MSSPDCWRARPRLSKIGQKELILGFDIGGTKTAVVLGSGSGEIHWREQFSTEASRGFEPMFQDLVKKGREALSISAGKVVAASVSIGGPLDVVRGIIKSPPNLPGWSSIPLKEMLSRTFELPVYIEHDGNAGALAEFYFGAGRGLENIIFITMGTGFGAGLILQGRLYRGTSDVAGEIGHIRIAETGPRCYGKAGSLEGYGSGSGIAELAQIMYPGMWGRNFSVIDLYREYKAGSLEAQAVFARAALYLGRGLAVLADILNPQRIILGGLALRVADALVAPAQQIFSEEALPEARAVCQIVVAQLGESIGDIASLCAAYDQGGLLERSIQA